MLLHHFAPLSHYQRQEEVETEAVALAVAEVVRPEFLPTSFTVVEKRVECRVVVVIPSVTVYVLSVVRDTVQSSWSRM